MHGSAAVTTLDLKSALHRFDIYAEGQHKTTEDVSTSFKVHPSARNHYRSSSKGSCILCFVAYLIWIPSLMIFEVFSPDTKTHTTHVPTTIQRLTGASLILNPKKCHWAQTAVYLLGFLIDQTGCDLIQGRYTTYLSGHTLHQTWDATVPRDCQLLQITLAQRLYNRGTIDYIAK